MSHFLRYIILFTFLLLSCEGPVFEVPKDPDSIPPTLTLTFPPDQAVLSDTVLITAYAFDNLELEMVSVFLNDSLIIENKDAPYEYSWVTTDFEEDEYHMIYAKAQDITGNISQTNPIQVLVDNIDNIAPKGTLINPYSGQTLSGEITIIVEAEDNEGISFVRLFKGNDTLATLIESPYIYNWETTNEIDDLNYVIFVHVQDISGNQITLGPISVLIDNDEPTDIIPPNGTITNPPSAATVSGTVNIQVNAYDDIEMGSVDFIIDGNAVFQDTNSPYEYSWNTTEALEDTDHIINIIVTDAAGNSATLFPVGVVVDNVEEPDIIPPTVVMHEPAANQTVSGLVNITALVTDDVGINRVEFYLNYDLESTISSYPYTYEWNSTIIEDDTEHTWYAKAFDTSENDTQSQPLSVTVNNNDNDPPNGFFLYPYAGQTVDGIVDIQVSATDNIGIFSIEFFINSSSIGSVSNEPFIFSWDTETATDDEDHIISALITDTGSNETNIAPIAVIVDNVETPNDDTTPPVVAILTPISSQMVSDTVFISGFASDNAGIGSVQFFIDNELVATVTDSPYTHQWGTYDLTNESDHVIQMVASDLSANQTSAQPVMVTVQNEYIGEIEDVSLSASEGLITLTWDGPSDATMFKIYKDSVFLTETSNQSYDDPVEGGIQYCYQIMPVNSVGIEGVLSDEECGVPLLESPSVFNATVNDTNVTLGWSAVENASGYIIKRDDAEIFNGTDLTFTDFGLDYGMIYFYTVTAYDFEGTAGTTSDPLSVTMPEELIPPELSLSVSGTIGSLNWSSVATASAYRIFKNNEFIIEVDVLSYTTELIHGVESCFTITAINDTGSESDSSNNECGSGDFTPPTLSMSVTDSIATLNWDTVLSASMYKIFKDGSFLEETANTTYDNDIGTGTNTCFTISAVNSYGTESSASNEECGTGS